MVEMGECGTLKKIEEFLYMGKKKYLKEKIFVKT